MKHTEVDVFSHEDLEKAVDKAVSSCPSGYKTIDLNVNFMNGLWVVVAKIAHSQNGNASETKTAMQDDLIKQIETLKEEIEDLEERCYELENESSEWEEKCYELENELRCYL